MCRLLIFNANQTGMYVFQPIFLNTNKPSTLHSYLQKKFLACKSSLVSQHMYCKLDTALYSHKNDFLK